jgi:hypothetical protein
VAPVVARANADDLTRRAAVDGVDAVLDVDAHAGAARKGGQAVDRTAPVAQIVVVDVEDDAANAGAILGRLVVARPGRLMDGAQRAIVSRWACAAAAST